MPFDEIDKISTARLPATFSLAIHRGGAKPRAYVGLASEFIAEHRITAKDKFRILLGTGEHTGLLRLRRDKENGIVSPKVLKGGATFRLGHIPQLGLEGHPRERCDARMVDADTIEIRLPECVTGQRKLLPASRMVPPEPDEDPPPNETPRQKRVRLIEEQRQARLKRLGVR